MSWYRAGTVSVSQGSNAVIGVGTAFISNARVGDAFRGPDGGWYEITNIASNTALSIAPNYQGPTLAAGGYSLAPMQGYVKDSADQLRAATKAIAEFPDTKQDKAVNLTAFAGLAGATDRLPYFTGGGALSLAVLTAKARLFLARTDDTGMRAELGLGSAALATVTSSTRDANIGRVARIGDHGLGSLLPGIQSNELDDLRTSGSYYSRTDNGQGSLPVNSNGYIISIVYALTYARQTYINVTTGQEYYRLLLNGTWQPQWTQLPKASDFGTASALTATTSTTDSTTGRALKVADFGIGSQSVPLISDFGADIKPGWYYGYGNSHAQATPNAPVGSGGGAIAVLEMQGINSANYKSFIVCSQASTSDADMFFGSRVNASPPTWKRMLNLENCTRDPALGTGGIISSGSNANGRYIKFVDGTLIQTGRVSGQAITAIVNFYGTTSGTMYYVNVTVNLPISFYDNNYEATANVIDRGQIGVVIATSESVMTIQLRHTANTASISTASWIAIGRWKA